MKRIFVGIKIEAGKNFRKLIATVREEMAGDNIKWTDLENLHLTLAFLGYTPEERLSSISAMLKSCEGTGKFEISFKGFGVFRNLRDPRVFWAGIYQSDKLNSLQIEVVKALNEAGITLEDRPFSPHLTLGRIKHINDPDNLKVMLLKYHSTEIQKVHVDRVILFESILRHDGPVYNALETFKL